ncbi:MAG: M56 family metallopeptidase [Bacteroidota bacterium]
MDFIQSYIPEDIIYALGWTVVHSLWQGMLVALVMALVLMGLQHKSAKLRHELSGLSLFTIFVMALITFIIKYDAAQGRSIIEILVNPDWENVAAVTAEADQSLGNFMMSWADYFNQNLPLIVTVWLMGVAFFLLRLMGGYAYVQRLRYSNNQQMSPHWRHKLQKLSRRLPLRRSVELVESALVKVPMVIGYLKPAILLPLGIVNALSEEEIEAILAHELAHIHRNDYLLNIILSFVEVLFYYHPAVWWLAANVRAERENCCDDIGVQLCGNSLTYAKALVSIQEMHRSAPAFALSFSGRKKNQLLNRVKRILNQPQNKSNIMEKLAATTLLFLSILFLSMSAGSSSDKTTDIKEKMITVDVDLTSEDDLMLPTIRMMTTVDTLPGKNKSTRNTQTIIRTDDDQSVEMKIVDGEIKQLKIDGKVIPEEEYDEYTDLREELLDNVPPPPPAPPAITAPPVPPAITAPPAPKAPPAPAAIGSNSSVWFKKKNQKTVTTEKGEDGKTTIIIESEGEEEPIHIIVDGDQDYIIIDDAELQIGDTAIIIDEYDFPTNGFGTIRRSGSGENFFIFPGGQGRQFSPETEIDFHTLDSARFPSEGFQLRGYIGQSNAEIKELQSYLADSQIEAQGLMKRYHEDIAALQKAETAIQQELATIHRAEAQAQQEVVEQFQEEARARQEEMQRVMEVYQERQQNLIKERQHLNYGKKDVSQILEDELLKDGLIASRDRYSMSLTPKKLKINGKRQSASVLKKYRALYEKHTGIRSDANGNSSSNYHIHISK